MPTRNRILGWALLIQAVASGLAVRVSAGDASSPAPSAVDVEFFERRVRPILASRCFECHAASASKQRGGLWLDSREAILSGGDSGPAAVPGSADESLLIQAIRYDSEGIQMPPAGQLPLREREILEEWVRRGLPFPAVAAAAARKARVDVAEGRQHWAYQPLRPVTLPQAVGEHAGWDVRRTDRFIAAGHAAHELVPAPSAPRRSFLRRVKLDLLGLPPDPDEIVAFEQDESPQACERLVDRLLADPAYGERWGRHWLDLARYCDVPESWREGQGQPWLYRDWVIRSLNEDLGYNQFVRRQLAADLLDDTQPADNAALGFIGLSPTYWKELKLDHLVIQQVVAEEWEERMDALGSTFLGLTLACARCHDHKYDAITIDDYYALAGVLASVRLEDRSILPGDQTRVADEGRQRIGWLQQQIDKLLASKPVSAAARQQADELRREMDEVRRTTPGLEIPLACGLSDAALHVLPVGENRTRLEYRPGEALDLAIHIRGNPANRGPVVARRFLSVLAADSPPPFRRGSGRLDLADALVGEAGPLLARVMVNRVWAHHFGRGLVATPSNFGVQGDPPTHPELLEDLAHRFVDHGWSLKWLHREIVLSSTYRQSTSGDDGGASDPDNVWLARMPLRRVEVEVWRDAMLVAADELDRRIGGEPRELLEEGNVRRSVYGTVKRRELSDLLRLYDFPDPVAHSARREPTTTPLQQLFVLNSPFLARRSASLARRLEAAHPHGERQRIELAYKLLFGRAAEAGEVAAAERFLSSAVQSDGGQRDGGAAKDAWEQYLQVLLGSNELLFVD